MGKMGFRNVSTDPFVYQEITGGNSCAIGLDNSDSDKLKIAVSSTYGVNPSGIADWVMTVDGERTMPLHPCFIARLNTESNVTGNGFAHFIGSVTATTEIVDRGNNFFPGDGAGNSATFTCPIQGKYIFHFALGMRFDVAGGLNEFIQDVYLPIGPVIINLWVGPTSNKVPNLIGSNNVIVHSGSCTINATAGDLVRFLFSSSGGAKLDSVIGFPTVETYISGALLY